MCEPLERPRLFGSGLLDSGSVQRTTTRGFTRASTDTMWRWADAFDCVLKSMLSGSFRSVRTYSVTLLSVTRSERRGAT